MLPQPLAFLPKLLEGFQAPQTALDPWGAWDHTYRVFTIGFLTSPHREWQRLNTGTLRLRREPLGPGQFRLRASFAAIQSGGNVDRIEAEVICATDRLATLRSWRRRTLRLARDGRPVPGTMQRETGRVTGNQLVRRSGRERITPVPSSLTCNWALFDVLQRLPLGNTRRLSFAMLEELDFLRPNQRLLPREPIEIELGDQRFRWQRFEQFGDGVLPWTYCLDDQQRVVLAFTVMRAYLLDPTATVEEVAL